MTRAGVLRVERQQRRDSEHGQRHGRVGRHHAEDRKGEDAERDSATEAKAVDVDGVTQPRARQCDGEGEADTDARGGGRAEQDTGFDSVTSVAPAGSRLARRPRTTMTAGRGRSRRFGRSRSVLDREDDEAGEPFEGPQFDESRNRRRKGRFDERDRINTAPMMSTERACCRGPPRVRLTRQRRWPPAEDEQAHFEDAHPGRECPREDEHWDDAETSGRPITVARTGHRGRPAARCRVQPGVSITHVVLRLSVTQLQSGGSHSVLTNTTELPELLTDSRRNC